MNSATFPRRPTRPWALALCTAVLCAGPVPAGAAGPICEPGAILCPAPSFSSPPVYSLSGGGIEASGVFSSYQGDFNGDGLPDLAAVTMGGATGADRNVGVAVFLAAGRGRFRAPVHYPAGPYPIQVTSARLRGPNASLDLIVSDAGANEDGTYDTTVLLGNGDGTFQAPQIVATSAFGSAVSMATADFNGDGRMDLAVSNTNGLPGTPFKAPEEMSVLLGNGDGTFQQPVPAVAGDSLSWFYEMVVGDFNNDGHPDVLGMDPVGLWLIPGLGDGTFAPGAMVWADPATYLDQTHLLGGPSSVAAADFDGDGNLDAALDVNGERVDVLLGTGAGAFRPAAVPTYVIRDGQMGYGGGSMRAADLDADGAPDLVVTTGYGATLVTLLGHGDGTFATPVIYPLPSPDDDALTIGDFDGNGSTDVVVATGGWQGRNYLTLLLNDGAGAFPLPQQFPVVAPYNKATQTNAIGVTLGDLDRDGKPDLVVTEWDLPVEPAANRQVPSPPRIDTASLTVDNGGSIAVMLGNGDGTFKAESQYYVGGRPVAAAIADLTGDGARDVVVANGFSGTVSVLKGNGHGSLQPAVTYAVGAGANAVALADFNRDGKPDIAVTNGGDDSVSVLLNASAPGTLAFTAPVRYATGTLPSAIAVADLDGDGRLDLAITNNGDPYYPGTPSTLSLLHGNGDGTFAAAPIQQLWQAHGADAIALGDFAGRGILDLAVANFALGQVMILRGTGAGTFVPAALYRVGDGPESIAVADYNGDGRLDLAVADLNDNTIALLGGRGDGSFVAAAEGGNADPLFFGWPAGPYPTFITSGDLDADGKPDLVAGNLFIEMVTVLRNTAATPQAPVASLTSSTSDGLAPLGVTFDASGSVDPNTGEAVSAYAFDFGDGSAVVAQATPMASHTYSSAGRFEATVTVTDRWGRSSRSAPVGVTVRDGSPAASLVQDASNRDLANGPVVAVLSATATNFSPGETLTYTFHFGDGATHALAPTTQTTVADSHSYAAAGDYRAHVTVTGAKNVVQSSEIVVQVVQTLSQAPAPPAASGGGAFGEQTLTLLAVLAALRRRRR